MDKTRILETYAKLAQVSAEEALAQQIYVTLAMDRIEKLLRGPEQDKDTPLLEMVAAALVQLWVCRAEAASSPTGRFSGNGYSISKDANQQLAAAQALFEGWRSAASGLLRDAGFAFLPTGRGEDDETAQ